jgi:hypothetical protein
MSARSTRSPRKILASQITRAPIAVCSRNPRETITQSYEISKPLRPLNAGRDAG